MRADIRKAAPLLLVVPPEHQALPQQLHWRGRLPSKTLFQGVCLPRCAMEGARQSRQVGCHMDLPCDA